MKKTGKGIQQDEYEDDSFDIAKWKATKKRGHSPPQLPPKKVISLENGKKTLKYKQDPVMQSLITSILRESDKFPDEVKVSSDQQELLVEEYRPNMIAGVVIDPHECSKEQRLAYGLQDQVLCMQFDLNSAVRVVVVGRIGYLPCEGIPVHLFLPKQMADYMQLKQSKQKMAEVPRRVVRALGKTVVRVQRKIEESRHMLDYAYFVLDPSNLIYPTYLCSWIDCKRRLALVNYIAEPKTVNQHMVFGTTCHRLLQWLAEGKLTADEYERDPEQLALSLYDSMLYDMFLVQKTFKEFWQVCKLRLLNIAHFYQRYILEGQELSVEPYRKLSLKITSVVESQIMLRSSAFGLKGKIDLLLRGELIDRKKETVSPVLIPMELKTGKRVSDSHKRQTDIYNILVRGHYNQNTIGLLYYSDSDIKFFRYEDPLSVFEIVVVHRNMVAESLLKIFQYSEGPSLPPFAQTFSQCHYCQQSQQCEITHHYLEESKELQNVPSKYHQSIKKSIQSYGGRETAYLARWLRWLHLEERQFVCNQTSLCQINISKFNMERQALACLSSEGKGRVRMNLSHRCHNQSEATQFDQFYKISLKMRCLIPEISLIQNCKVCETEIKSSTMEFKMVVQFNNKQIKFSSKKLNYNLAEAVRCTAIFQTFQNSFFPSLRKTVFNLVTKDHIIKQLALQPSQEANQQILKKVEGSRFADKRMTEGLNQDQICAFRMAVQCQKFCLIEGMPGTGKTELIIRLVDYFCGKGLRVLVTTFTNRALDNILGRLEDSERLNPQILIRQGSQYSTSNTLKHFTSQSQSFENIEEYNNYFEKKKAWFVTLSSLSIHHLPQEYDFIILDEASQCLQPSCAEALLRGKRFIMIGDYHQLQPLVRSKKALDEGMGVSFFQRLCKLYPNSVVSLNKQYRMNKQIMSLSNSLVYEGRLKYGSEVVGGRSLTLMANWEQKVPVSFHDVFMPNSKVVFINYDPVIHSLSKKYQSRQESVRKVIQTQLPAFIGNAFRTLEVPASSIAIIAALNISVNRISELLICSDYKEGAVMTIDRSQGMDKDVVVILIEKGSKQLMQNPRRLNVALTRAKCKMIVIGSEEHLQNMKVWDGTLAKLFKPFQLQLTRSMVQDMMKGMSLKATAT